MRTGRAKGRTRDRRAVGPVSLCIVLALAACACRGAAPGYAPPGEVPEGGVPLRPHVALDDTHDGARVTMGVNEHLALSLAANRSTGYEWRIERCDLAIIEPTGNSYEFALTSQGLAGAGGYSIWTFKTVGPGETTLSLVYERPWERGKKTPAKRFTIVVEAAPEAEGN